MPLLTCEISLLQMINLISWWVCCKRALCKFCSYIWAPLSSPTTNYHRKGRGGKQNSYMLFLDYIRRIVHRTFHRTSLILTVSFRFRFHTWSTRFCIISVLIFNDFSFYVFSCQLTYLTFTYFYLFTILTILTYFYLFTILTYFYFIYNILQRAKRTLDSKECYFKLPKFLLYIWSNGFGRSKRQKHLR